ncbi:MAG TPA: hypothetical protein VF610_01370 [Segetibacter sp.]
MPFTKLLFTALGIISISCSAQQKETDNVTDVSKITFLNPGVSYEKRIGKLQTLYGQVFMATSFGFGYSSSMGSTSIIYIDPAATLQYRYYYNFKKREAKDKRTELNSGNYVCSILETTFSKHAISLAYYHERNRRLLNTLGIAWGFQRNYSRRFSLDLNLGLGYLYTRATTGEFFGEYVTKNVGQLTSVGQLNLGFWLNKRN